MFPPRLCYGTGAFPAAWPHVWMFEQCSTRARVLALCRAVERWHWRKDWVGENKAQQHTLEKKSDASVFF